VQLDLPEQLGKLANKELLDLRVLPVPTLQFQDLLVLLVQLAKLALLVQVQQVQKVLRELLGTWAQLDLRGSKAMSEVQVLLD
jgi:hypothetical protein